MSDPILLADGIEIEVEPIDPNLTVSVEIPPFATQDDQEVTLVAGPPGEEGPPADPNEIELEVDPVLIFENALIG